MNKDPVKSSIKKNIFKKKIMYTHVKVTISITVYLISLCSILLNLEISNPHITQKSDINVYFFMNSKQTNLQLSLIYVN